MGDDVASERSGLRQELMGRIRRDLPASILGAGPVGAELRTLGRVYAEDAYVLAVDFYRVAVNDAGAANQVAGFRRDWQQGCYHDE
jgi:hypothetical protein